MPRGFGRRLLLVIPTIFGVVTVVFLVIHLAPGGPVAALLGDYATPKTVALLRHEYGFDQPLWIQYAEYIRNVLSGNFGVSFVTNQPAMAEVLSVFPYTLELTVAALVIDLFIGIAAGVIAAVRVNTWADQTSMIAALAFVSAPTFMTGLILLLVFAIWLPWFPVTGAGSGNWGSIIWHLVLPAVTLGASRASFTARITRSCMVDVLSQDYIRTARAKGMIERVVIYRHALRNALIQVITVVSLNFGQLLGGSVVVEAVFVRPGLGTLVINAINNRDYVQAQAAILFFASVYILVNVITDFVYTVVDPRLRDRVALK